MIKTQNQTSAEAQRCHLAVYSGGVMPRPEHLEQVVVAARQGVVLHPYHLGVVGGAGAHILVGGLVEAPLAVANLRLGHTGHPLEGKLDAPEAAGAELGKLLPGRGRIFVGALRDR